MKKYRLYFSFLCCIVFFTGISGCIDTSRGSIGTTRSIAESKQNGFFICELCPDVNPYKVNDTLILDIKEAWIENLWQYVKWNTKKKVEGYQIVINVNSKSLKSYEYTWSIGNSRNSYFTSDEQKYLGIELKSLPNPVVFKYKINQGSYEFDSNGKQIGLLVLRKKPEHSSSGGQAK